MSSQATWRGDDPGFQTQAVGNYPDKSDVADKDNIYLTDQGWVYRHFKSLDKSKYWDEIIWAGYVNSAVTANDPVDAINDPAPEFLVGDGIQFVSGVYPGVDPTIGTSEIGGAASVDTAAAIPYTVSVSGTLANGNTFAWSVDGPGTAVIGTATGTFTGNTPAAIPYTVSVSGTLANGNTFAWSVDGPGTAVIGTATGTFTGNTPAQANTNITFPTAGTYNITCLIKSSATASTGSVANFGVTAAATVADTLGTVTVSGQQTPDTGATPIEYTITHTGTAPEGDITYALVASPSANVTIAQSADKNVFNVTWAAATDGVATTLTATLTDGDASDSPATGTLAVTPATP